MTTLFRARQRAEDFAALVDGTPVRSAAGPQDERLVQVAQLLRGQADDARSLPRESFALELRERLMTEAATVLTPQNAGLALPHRTRGKRERRLVAVASAAVLLGGTAGMAAAAQSALPGEALYPIKRGIENAQAGLSTSSAARGRDLLDQASGRLDEVHGLLEVEPATGAPQVPHTLDLFDSQARDGAELLMTSYQENGDPESIAAVRAFAARGLTTIEALSAVAPASTQADLREAAVALRDIDARASALCPDCADLPALKLPASFLASAEVDRALRLLQASKLDNSHPVIVEKQVARQVQAPSGGDVDGGPDGAVAAPQLPGPQTGGAQAPQAPSVTGAPKVKVKVDLDPGTVTEDLQKNLSGTLPGQLGDGLGDVVETLLPDPDTDLLP
jgi:hypothetical protein